MKPLFLLIALSLFLSTSAQTDNILSKAGLMKSQSKEVSEEALIMNKVDASGADSITNGLIEVKDEQIDLLIQDYVENKKLMGYRIQVFSSSKRLDAQKIRLKVVKKFPDEKSYLIYQAPNFKVRVGNYRDRLSAQEHLEQINVEFPSSFIVKEEIEVDME